MTTFAPFYAPQHPRFSKVKDSAFVYLQPEYSFDNHGISRDNPYRKEVKNKIRKAFRAAGSPYKIALVEQPFEALKYLKPLKITDPPVRWWLSKE